MRVALVQSVVFLSAMTVGTALADHLQFGHAELFTYPFDPSWLLTFAWAAMLTVERYPRLRTLAALNLIVSLGLSLIEWQPNLLFTISDQFEAATFVLAIFTAWTASSDVSLQQGQFLVASLIVWCTYVGKYLLAAICWDGGGDRS